MASHKKKLTELAARWGYGHAEAFIGSLTLSKRVPGICTTDGCSHSTHVEPNEAKGLCKDCGTRTVASAMVLAGIIQKPLENPR